MNGCPTNDRLLCRLDDVPDGQAFVAMAALDEGMTEVVIVRRDQAVWAYINRCPHFSVRLDFDPGDVITYRRTVMMCAHHSALFRFEDGHCIEGPCTGTNLTPLPVRVVDGQIRYTADEKASSNEKHLVKEDS